MAVKSALALPSQPPQGGFSFGPSPNPFQSGNQTTAAGPANSVVLRFASSVGLFSDLVTCKELRMNLDSFFHPVNPALPVFPGVTLVRSLNQNLQFAISWNWFEMRYSPKNYWLYERKDRLIFKTILLIRKFRSTALTFIDMNVIRLIFDLIAVPLPLMLVAAEHARSLQVARGNFRRLEEEVGPRADVDLSNLTYSLSTLGSSFVPKVLPLDTLPSTFRFWRKGFLCGFWAKMDVS